MNEINETDAINSEVLVISEIVLWLCRTGFALRWFPDNADAMFCPIPSQTIAQGYAAIDPQRRGAGYWHGEMVKAAKTEVGDWDHE